MSVDGEGELQAKRFRCRLEGVLRACVESMGCEGRSREHVKRMFC